MGLFWHRPPAVERLKQKADVEGLLRALRYEDPITDADGHFADLGAPVRAEAAAALAELDVEAARDGLADALADPEESVRLATLHALATHRGEHAVELLARVAAMWIAPELSDMREEAIAALRDRHPATAPRHVAAAMLRRRADLEEDDIAVFRRLAQSAGLAGLRAVIDDLLVGIREEESPERASTLLVALAPESVGDLLGLLGDPDVNDTAALALGQTHDSRAVAPLSAMLADDPDPIARQAAASALGEIRDPAASEALLAAASDPDYEVRAAAIEAFEKLGSAGLATVVGAHGAAAVAEAGEPEPAAAPEPKPEPTLTLPPAGGPPHPGRHNGAPYTNGSRTEHTPAVEFMRASPLRRLLGR